MVEVKVVYRDKKNTLHYVTVCVAKRRQARKAGDAKMLDVCRSQHWDFATFRFVRTEV